MNYTGTIILFWIKQNILSFRLKFSIVAGPPNEKLHVKWTERFDRMNEKENRSMEDPRDNMISPPVHASPRNAGRFTLNPDEGNARVESVLLW